MALSSLITAIFFDLDGTLIDTAPDLAWAINQLRAEYGLPPLALEIIRPTISHGTPGMLQAAFNLDRNHPDFQLRRKRLLEIYQGHLVHATGLFPGMAETLNHIENAGLRWGVVTNKPSFLTDPIVAQLGLAPRAVAVVSGDTTPFAKPHPAPLIHACALAGVSAAQCVYVGDAERDIVAGRAAGLKTLVAGFGYLSPADHPENWGADAIVATPSAILDWVLGKHPPQV